MNSFRYIPMNEIEGYILGWTPSSAKILSIFYLIDNVDHLVLLLSLEFTGFSTLDQYERIGLLIFLLSSDLCLTYPSISHSKTICWNMGIFSSFLSLPLTGSWGSGILNLDLFWIFDRVSPTCLYFYLTYSHNLLAVVTYLPACL